MSPAPAGSPRVTPGDLFWSFLRVAVRGFGGALPWARRMLVEERRWLTAREFTETLGLCQLLPGANVVNVAVVVGARFHGAPGALLAALGLMGAPLVLVLGLGALYTRFGQAPGIDAALRGVGPAAVGLLVATGLRMAAPLAREPRSLVVLVTAFAGVALLRWPLVPLLVGLVPVAVVAAWVRRG